MKRMFNKVENNIRKRWCLRSAVLLHRDNTIDLLCKSMGWFIFNGNTSLKWQRECMIRVNTSLKILFIISNSKRSVKLQPAR